MTFKRFLFLSALFIFLFYVKRDFHALSNATALLIGLSITFLVALAGLLIVMYVEQVKEKSKVKGKLGERTYNWLTEED